MQPSRKSDRHRQTPLAVRIPDDLREQVRLRAEAEERTQTQVIRRALRRYLDQVPESA